MKRKRILHVIQILFSFLFLAGIYFSILKYIQMKHFSEFGFISGITAAFCGILYGYLGNKYIQFVYPKRFDTKTRILIPVLCCLFGAGITFICIEQFVGVGLSFLMVSLLKIDSFDERLGFAYPLLAGILSPAFAVILYNILLEKHLKQ